MADLELLTLNLELMTIEVENLNTPQKQPLLIADVSSSYIGKECFWVDKVTHSKKFEGKPLGKCVSEGIPSLHKLPIVFFDKPFLGFTWQYKSDVRL